MSDYPDRVTKTHIYKVMNGSIHPEDTASICVPKHRDSKDQKQK